MTETSTNAKELLRTRDALRKEAIKTGWMSPGCYEWNPIKKCYEWDANA